MEMPRCEYMGEHWFAKYCLQRDASIAAYLNAQPGVRWISGYFGLDDLKPAEQPLATDGTPRGILVQGVLLDSVRSADVLLSEGAPISPRKLLSEAQNPPALQLMSNYLFFLTGRLCELYNALRAGRPREQTSALGGHIDYMLYTKDGKRVETFPLFKKACMAMKRDGSFVFFHFRLRGGELRLNGQPLSWGECDVDPVAPGDVAVYTPYLSRADEGVDRMTYTKAIGEGRYNIVIVQNEVICARDGDVLLPGMGVVVSLSRELGAAYFERAGFARAEDGYFDLGAKPVMELRLQSPAEIAPEDWSDIEWAYGGGLTLMSGGKAVFAPGVDNSPALAEEGWATPLSAQTQESDIAALARHPRTAIGLTRQGKLFVLVYSGRSAISAGADYIEMCELARQLVPDARDFFNVDGGGSSVLGLGVGPRFIECSTPSSTPGSLSGMVRPVNSLFRMVIKQ